MPKTQQLRSISLYEFGGSEAVVRRVQARFVDFFYDCAPVLDIGCGRGIFLELLSTAGIEAVGIDHSEEALGACREKGLLVHREEARSYLRHNAEQFGGIFCSHVIEHMSYEDAMEFLELCHGGLRTGGVLILITPNPDDLCVMSKIFWLDPTHVRPYPKLLLEKMLGAVGFEIRMAEQFLGSWRLVGRRNIPGYLLRRMILGPHYGKPNTLIVGKKLATTL